MNPDEMKTYAIKSVIAAMTWLAARYLPADASATLSAYIPTMAAGLVAAAAFAYGAYRSTNMKLVPEHATAVVVPGGPAVVGTSVNVPGLAKVVGAILIAFVALHATSASAQTKPATPTKAAVICTDALNLIPIGCTPNPSGPITTANANLQTLWTQIVSATQADLTYALALAKNVNSPGSQLRATCYSAIITANAQANGTTLKNADGSPMVAPNPAVIAKFEQAAELVDNLQPTAPVMSACAAAANAVAQSTTQFLTTVLNGVALKAVTGGVAIP